MPGNGFGPTEEAQKSHLAFDLRGSTAVYGARLGSLLLGAALTVGAARLLAPVGLGEYATIVTSTDLGVQIANFGISSSLLVLLSRDPQRVRAIAPRLWWFTAVWMIALGALFRITLLASPGLQLVARWWPLLTIWIPLKLLRLNQLAALTALEAYAALSGLEVLARSITVGLGLGALVYFRQDLFFFVAALVLSELLNAVFGAALLQRVAARQLISASSAGGFYSKALRVAFRAYPLLLLPWILVRSDVLLVRAFRGPTETGLYSVASQIVEIGLLLPSTLAAFTVPALMRGAGTAQGLLRLSRRLGLLVAAGSLLIALVGKPLITLVLGKEYLGVYRPLVFLLPGFIALALETLLVQHFSLQEFPSFLSLYWLFGVCVNLSLNIALIPRFGITAAATTSSLGYILVFLLVLRRFLRDTGIHWGRALLGQRIDTVS